MAVRFTVYSTVTVYSRNFGRSVPFPPPKSRRARRPQAMCAAPPRLCACVATSLAPAFVRLTHAPTLLVRAEEPKEVEIPAELQAAVDGGNVELVKEMLKTPPEGMSKSLVKKLIKNSEIAAKKLATAAAKGRPATAPTPAAPKAKATPAGTGSSAAAAGAAAPPAAAISTGHTTAEDVIVADLLACLKALEVPEGVLASIEAQRGSLRGAIAPRVTALRNSAYAQGFSAKASI